MTPEELKELCNNLYPNCKECPFYKNDCERYDEGHDLHGLDRVLPKDW